MRDGWQTTELGELVSIASGGTPSKENQAFWGGEIPWITAKDLKRKYLTDSIDRLTRQGTINAKLTPAGALLILVRGMTLFRDVPLGIAVRPVAFNQDIKALVPGRQVDSEYLFYSLICSKEALRRLVDTAGHGTGRLDTSALLSHPIDYPTEHRQQRRIAEILRSWDEAIETTERLIAAKERRLNALADQLLFGTRRLGSRQTNGFNHYRWFNIPSDWKCPYIGELAEQSSLRNAGSAQIPVLSCTKYDGLVDSLTYFGRKIFSEDTSNYRVVRRGEFAYATNHLEEGSIGYLDFLDAGLISPMYTVFHTDGILVDDRFLLKVFKTKTFLHIFRANTSSSVDRRGGLRWEDFARIRVPLPRMEEQAEINEVLAHARHESDIHRKQLLRLQHQKRGLMQKLLTGEWRAPLRDSEVDDLAERAAAGEAA